MYYVVEYDYKEPSAYHKKYSAKTYSAALEIAKKIEKSYKPNSYESHFLDVKIVNWSEWGLGSFSWMKFFDNFY